METKRPWLKFYDSHVSANLPYPECVLPEALRETSRRHPDHPAMLFKGRRITYRQYDQAVDRFASALQALGVQKGDRVAVHLPNCPQYLISYYGTLRAGGIVVPCNPIYTARELKFQLNDSGASVLVTLSSTYPTVRPIRADTCLRHVVVAKIKTFFPVATRWLFTLFFERRLGHAVSISADADTSWFSEFLAEAPARPHPVQIDGGDTAVLMYTGGTTGVSKGAELTHRNILVNAYQVLAWVNAEELKDSTLTALPLFHSYGMTCCMNPGALQAGTAILIVDPRDLKDILSSLNRYRPSFYPGVPAMYAAINNHGDVGKYNLRSLKVCNSGAAPLPPEVQTRFQQLTGARLIEGYGLSEASPITHSNPCFGENRIGTIGLPWPDTEARIVDLQEGRQVLGPGQVGELCVRGPQVMKGYWNNPTETALVLRPDPEGGPPWLYTGDLASMDSDGYFRIVDRKKEMILGAGGYNIYPREIEDVLYGHPKVREAAACGIPIPEKGEQVKVFIALKDGATCSEQEIINYCRQNLAPYKIPKQVEFRQELPRTLVGKVLRRELREAEIARIRSEASRVIPSPP
ncbi:MAG: long-chain fatty acid--CoA ligase [Anaerolineales bacterium]|jgi:long-chain acyl-CoA synthetase